MEREKETFLLKEKNAMQTKKWVVTPEKFLNEEQISSLVNHLMQERDLALARSNHSQALKDYYGIRTLLESGLRVFEFCALVNGDFIGQKLSVRCGKGNKPRTVLLTKATALMLKEWLGVKERLLGYSVAPDAPLFPSRLQKRHTTRAIQKRVRMIFNRLDFPSSLTTHSLRHTYISLLLAKSVPLPIVRDNAGHSSLSITNIYSHAVGDLGDLELLSNTPSSEFSEKGELREQTKVKRKPNYIKKILGSTNFQTEDVNSLKKR